jgi:serine phosphatase RsbU (regulator of sigma subunit)/anti-sigma regulatory factor (Ser/Thr protein kinase)
VHVRLTTEHPLGADLAGDPGDLVGERRQLVHHRVHGPADPVELAPQGPALDLQGHVLRQVTFGDGRDDAGDLRRRPREVVDQRVHRRRTRRPPPVELVGVHPLQHPALTTHDPADAQQVAVAALLQLHHRVETVHDLAREAGTTCDAHVELALADGGRHRHELLQQTVEVVLGGRDIWCGHESPPVVRACTGVYGGGYSGPGTSREQCGHSLREPRPTPSPPAVSGAGRLLTVRSRFERRARFPGDAGAPSAARRFVRSALGEAGLAELADDAVLLVSELCENAVLHAGTGFTVHLIADGVELTISITDQGSTPMELRRSVPPDPGSRRATHGRGLVLVDAIATAWGSRHDSDGHRVWFTLRATAPAPVTPAPAASPEGVWPDPDSTRWLLHLPAPPSSLPVLVTELLRRLCDVLGATGGTVVLADDTGESLLAAYGEKADGENADGGVVTVPLPLEPPRSGRLAVYSRAVEAAELAALTAQRVTLAVEADKQHSADREQWLWMSYLAEATEMFGNSLDVRLTAAIVPQVLVPRLGRWCALHLLDDRGRLRLEALTHVHEDELGDLRLGLAPLTEPDGALTTLITERTQAAGLGSPLDAVAVPLRVGGRAIGTVSVGRPFDRVHRPEELLILTELARRAAQSLDNAQRDSAHAATSQALQQALLPRALPTAEGVRFAAAYLPVSAGADVGGDFYDVLALGPGRWLAVVGDVCGKGPRAAARTGLVRDVLRVLLRDGQPLGRTFELLNEMMLEAGDPSQFATVALAVITRQDTDPVSLAVELVLAGHEQPALVHHDGTVNYLGTHGSAVGLVRRFAVHPTRHVLLAGDTLVFYTDGVTEHRRGVDLFGPDRLADALRRATPRTADGVINAVRQAVDDFSPEPHRDDIAIVAVQVPSKP